MRPLTLTETAQFMREHFELLRWVFLRRYALDAYGPTAHHIEVTVRVDEETLQLDRFPSYGVSLDIYDSNDQRLPLLIANTDFAVTYASSIEMATQIARGNAALVFPSETDVGAVLISDFFRERMLRNLYVYEVSLSRDWQQSYLVHTPPISYEPELFVQDGAIVRDFTLPPLQG